jgi:hypothetical protein
MGYDTLFFAIAQLYTSVSVYIIKKQFMTIAIAQIFYIYNFRLIDQRHENNICAHGDDLGHFEKRHHKTLAARYITDSIVARTQSIRIEDE